MSGYSNFSRKRITAKAFDVTHVEFFDGYPNYFRVTNNGTGKLYFSCNRVPSANNYDFSCDADSVKLWAEPFERSFLDIYNPTGSDIEVDLMTFSAEFDPLALAFSGFTVDMSGMSIDTNLAIGSFNTSLPTGSNTIGKVDVNNLINYTTTLSNIYAKLTENKNTASYSDLLGLIHTAVNNVKSAVDGISVTGGGGGGSAVPVTTFGGGSSDATIESAAGTILSEIVFLSNDSEGDIVVTLTNRDGSSSALTLKAGEVLNNVQIHATSIVITANGNAYRYGYNSKAV